MKNQYVGDITDYIKYGVLRRLIQAGFSLGVHWTLTPDDGSSDGSRTNYLLKHREWRHYDPEVYDAISRHLGSKRRDLGLVEEEGLLPRARLCTDVWTGDPDARRGSITRFLNVLESQSLVFFDPDNGIAVPSVPVGSTASSKYVRLEEVALAWEAGHSLIIYQHFPRVKREPYARAHLLKLSELFGDDRTAAILTSHVAFLFCFQDVHLPLGFHTLESATKHWLPATRLITVNCDPPGEREIADKHRSHVQLDLPL